MKCKGVLGWLFGQLGGVNIFSDANCVSTTFFKPGKTQRKRQVKKWKSQERNYKKAPAMYKMGETIICHPSIYQKLKQGRV